MADKDVRPRAVSGVMRTQSAAELEKYMGDKYGIKLDIKRRGLKGDKNFSELRDQVAAVEDIMSEFPKAAPFFKAIDSNEKRRSAAASAGLSGEIHLGTAYTDTELLKNSYYGSAESGFHPAGTTYKDILAHESGHVLEAALLHKKYGLMPGSRPTTTADLATWRNVVRDWNKGAVAKDICTTAYNNISESKRAANITLARKGISRYATETYSETIAEAVADYRANKNKANPFSIEIWKELKRQLK